jgi:23S rRNA pseudoU1915 N3-methylase RlmH
MKLLVVAVGQRQPAWADEAWADFAKRFPPEMRLELKALKAEPRQGGKTAAQCMAAEAARFEAGLAQGRAPRRAGRTWQPPHHRPAGRTRARSGATKAATRRC